MVFTRKFEFEEIFYTLGFLIVIFSVNNVCPHKPTNNKHVCIK